MEKKEIRSVVLENVETRVADNGVTTLTGYAAKFNQLTDNLWGFREKISAGAFQSTLQSGADVKALWNHDTNLPIGSTNSGTLTLSEDNIGLRFELSPINTTAGKDALEAVRSGVVNGVSFGFYTKRDSWDWTDEQNPVRTLEDVQLLEISPTPFPAYPQTNVSARNMEEILNEASVNKPKKATDNELNNVDIRRKKLKLKF